MKKINVQRVIEKMIDGTELKMKSIETNSHQEFYHQGAVDALNIALEMVKDINEGENRFLDGIETDDV